MLFKLYFLTKLCLHTIYKYLINGLLTNLQEQYFTTCFHACSTVSCRHHLLTNCEILVCRLQSFSIFLNEIKMTFTASDWYFELYKLYVYTNRHLLTLDNTKAAYSYKSVLSSTYFQVILISFMHVNPHVELQSTSY